MPSLHDLSATEVDNFHSWVRCMKAGDFEGAWMISDEALSSTSPSFNDNRPLHLRKVWNGQPLEGKRVLVRCYHGLGDIIQFSRYIPMVKRISAEVSIALPPSLVELFFGAEWMSGVRLLAGVTASYGSDVEIEIMELAHVFRTTEKTIPPIPPLKVEPVQIPRDERLAVGIAWRAGTWDDRRSIDFDELWPLQRVSGISLFSIQLEPYAAGWHDDLGTAPHAKGVFRTAQLIQRFDLIISVDTMTAHLAGALGKPVWTLLQADADWRWMRGTTESPWYPTMRLFRQQHPEDWAAVIEQVIQELEHITYGRRNQHVAPHHAHSADRQLLF